jgi:RimJ/RimL family protein N-acetyltransferase
MILTTKRLILRFPTTKDIKEVCEGLNNLDVSKWLLVYPYPYSIKEARKYLKGNIKKMGMKKKDKYSFLIELKSEKRVIGGIGVRDLEEHKGTGVIGFWINQDYWSKGYAYEACKAVLDFAFKKLKLRRVEATVVPENIASSKLLEKLSFQLEGKKKESAKSKADNKVYDELIYGLLARHWLKRRIEYPNF